MRSKNVIKNIFSSLGLQVTTIICGFITPVLIIQAYGSEANGLLASITQFLGYITLLESGFGPVVKSVLYKHIADKNKEMIQRILKASEKFFRRIALIFVFYIIILCVIYPMIVSAQFDAWFTISLLVIMAFSTLAEYFFGMTYTLYLQAKQKMYVTSILQTLTTIFVTASAVIMIKMGLSLQAVKLVSAFFFILKPLVQSYYVRKKYGINLKGISGDYEIKQKWDGLAQHIAAVIHSNTDIVVLTLFSSLAEVSVYAVYMLVINGLKRIVQSFNNGIDASFGDMIAKNEHEELNKKFSTYELFFHTISTVVFICAIMLITPFVAIYTNGINDADYIRPVFGVLIVISEFVWSIRLPYSSTVLAAGHFKQTRKGAWVEALSNIIISVILVFNFGIIGVAIGTIVAMFIRTIEFMYHNSKFILKRSAAKSFMWLPIIAVETLVACLVCNFVVSNSHNNYLEWGINALIVLAISLIVVLPINAITHREELFDLLAIRKNIKRKEEK